MYVFAGKTYPEFHQLGGTNYQNAEKYYLDYLRLTNQVASNMGTAGEQVEQFLFIFGNNLKTAAYTQ